MYNFDHYLCAVNVLRILSHLILALDLEMTRIGHLRKNI